MTEKYNVNFNFRTNNFKIITLPAFHLNFLFLTPSHEASFVRQDSN